ncbi:hypothetical protein BC830DRAFT_1163894 [Chytriomyces sp. MP71]|nr:hypothetical protein BC830DRAFT_1163894 [Chytriomyces sp. MP71]
MRIFVFHGMDRLGHEGPQKNEGFERKGSPAKDMECMRPHPLNKKKYGAFIVSSGPEGGERLGGKPLKSGAGPAFEPPKPTPAMLSLTLVPLLAAAVTVSAQGTATATAIATSSPASNSGVDPNACTSYACTLVSTYASNTPSCASSCIPVSATNQGVYAASQALSALAASYSSCVASSTCSGVYASQATAVWEKIADACGKNTWTPSGYMSMVGTMPAAYVTSAKNSQSAASAPAYSASAAGYSAPAQSYIPPAQAYSAPAQTWAGNVYYSSAEKTVAAVGLIAVALLF